MGRFPGKEEAMNENNLGILIPIIGVCIPIVAIVSTFVMIIFAIRYGTQRKEREAFYKAESLRRLTESSGEGAKAAIELLREEEHLRRVKAREGMKIGGLVCMAVGVALVIFMWGLAKTDPEAPIFVGLIPGLVGVALLVYVYFLAAPVE
jgi:multisubunit Na+/H+ antiporter MnhG subunit